MTLAPWPKYRDFAMKHGPTALASECYNNAMSNAWEARCRLAYAAMKEFEGFWKSGNSVPVDRAVIRSDHQAVIKLYEALAAIDIEGSGG